MLHFSFIANSVPPSHVDPGSKHTVRVVQSCDQRCCSRTEDFRQYVIDSNIGLVRSTFLEKLSRAGGVWPRRQEADKIRGATCFIGLCSLAFATVNLSLCLRDMFQ